MNVPYITTLLAATEAQSGAAEAAGGISTLGIDPLKIALQAGTFVLLFILLRRFAFNKITEVLNDRHETIEEGLANAHKMRIQLEESNAEQQKMLKEARVESEAVIAKAHEEAGIMLKETEERAAEKSEKIVADAHNRIESDVIKAKKELKLELSSLVAEATEAVIGEKMTSDIDKKLIERMLK